MFVEDDELPDYPPTGCEGCGRILLPTLVMSEKPCPTGECVIVACPICNHEVGGWGPVDCPACGSAPSWRKRLAWWLARWRR